MTAAVSSTVPVIVVGGGSVGLVTAVLLGYHGVDTVVVERRPGPSVHPRATGIGPRTVEILHELGLDTSLEDAALTTNGLMGKAKARTLVELGEDDFFDGAAPAPPPQAELDAMPFRLSGICSQDRLDALLATELARRGTDIRWSTELVSLTQDADGVEVDLEGPDGAHRLRCAHLVAADGTHSTVRNALGIGTSGPGDLGPPMVNILFRADLRPYLPERRFATCTLTTPEAPGLLGAVDGVQNWVFHAQDPEAEHSLQRCIELVRAAVGDPGLAVEVLSALAWRPRGLLADRFAQGRAFLVGDAAHTVSPLGAFGLNTGVADAHNLAWKLAAVHHGEAAPTLLDSYADEREPVAAATLDQAVRRLRGDPRLHWGRGPDADAARAAAGVWAAPIVHLGQRYASSAVIDPQPELPSTNDLAAVLDGSAGSRVPHAWVDHDGHHVSTLDLISGQWTLLTGRYGDPWLGAAARIALPVHRIVVPLPGLTDRGAMLIRPDAVIALRAPAAPSDPAQFLARSFDRVLGRLPMDRASGLGVRHQPT